VNALSFHGIHKSYGTKQAVRGVSFDVREGEIFGLLGPNGAGKTTLIRIFMDIIRPDEGDTRLFEQPLDGDALDRIGYLPEERGLYKKQKTLEVLAYFASLKGVPALQARHRAAAWLEKIGLAETGSWNIERLSKGMSQKVQIAAALIHEPQLAVLDEPFSGLDPVNVNLVQDLIRERKRQGKTTILSTHQMDMVEALCDRVALINKGELMVYGTVNEVRRQYSKNDLTISVDGELPPLPGVESVHHGEDGNYRVTLTREASSRAVFEALAASGLRVRRFEEVLAPMHDVFIAVVEGHQQ
jgi:ABC-2 type transport system ATP-binding protein